MLQYQKKKKKKRDISQIVDIWQSMCISLLGKISLLVTSQERPEENVKLSLNSVTLLKH